MKRLIEFTIDDGTTMTVEVDELERGGLAPAARPGEMITRAQISFEDALEKMRPATTILIKKLRSLPDQPDEIGVEFGLKLTAEAGAVLASAGAEANYKVILKWKDKKKE